MSFASLFSEIVRPRRLKLGIHVDSGKVYRLLLLIRPFISSFFILFNFQTLKCFVTLFSGTVRPRSLKLGTHVNSGQLYRVYRNQAAAAYLSLYFIIFLSLQFASIKIFVTHFTGTVRPRKLKFSTHVYKGRMYLYTGIRLLLLICLFIFYFSFSPVFEHENVSSIVRPRRLKLGTHVDNGGCIVCTEIMLLLLFVPLFLAHLSRRLIGELIEEAGTRRPSVRPSVCPSTFSNDISSEAMKPIFTKFHI